jgi:hypothetical protein
MNPRSPRIASLAYLLLGALFLATVLLASNHFATNPGDSLTRNTIRLSLAWYAVALVLMIRLRGAKDWRATTPLGKTARWCWTWACLTFIVHVALAFHYFHHWSHADAFEHTREVSGLGEGLYISYLFTLLWIADAIAWWLAPAWYTSRSRWIDRLLHGFMLFIVFNGTVIYEQGPIRWVAAAGFLILALCWHFMRTSRRFEQLLQK